MTNDERDLELCERQPVRLGGDPVDENNKMYLRRADHIQYVRYWNGVIRDLKARQQG